MDNGNDLPAPSFWNFLMKNRKSPKRGLMVEKENDVSYTPSLMFLCVPSNNQTQRSACELVINVTR